ncbi:MAG: YdaS family helix-turn-helix protein [Pseudomonadota bacterium]
MTLFEFVKTLDKDQLISFAERCGTSEGQIKQVAGGHRRAGESLAINIERETAGAITCDSLRPDVDWNYIRSTKPKKLKQAAA